MNSILHSLDDLSMSGDNTMTLMESITEENENEDYDATSDAHPIAYDDDDDDDGSSDEDDTDHLGDTLVPRPEIGVVDYEVHREAMTRLNGLWEEDLDDTVRRSEELLYENSRLADEERDLSARRAREEVQRAMDVAVECEERQLRMEERHTNLLRRLTEERERDIRRAVEDVVGRVQEQLEEEKTTIVAEMRRQMDHERETARKDRSALESDLRYTVEVARAYKTEMDEKLRNVETEHEDRLQEAKMGYRSRLDQTNASHERKLDRKLRQNQQENDREHREMVRAMKRMCERTLHQQQLLHCQKIQTLLTNSVSSSPNSPSSSLKAHHHTDDFDLAIKVAVERAEHRTRQILVKHYNSTLKEAHEQHEAELEALRQNDGQKSPDYDARSSPSPPFTPLELHLQEQQLRHDLERQELEATVAEQRRAAARRKDNDEDEDGSRTVDETVYRLQTQKEHLEHELRETRKTVAEQRERIRTLQNGKGTTTKAKYKRTHGLNNGKDDDYKYQPLQKYWEDTSSDRRVGALTLIKENGNDENVAKNDRNAKGKGRASNTRNRNHNHNQRQRNLLASRKGRTSGGPPSVLRIRSPKSRSPNSTGNDPDTPTSSIADSRQSSKYDVEDYGRVIYQTTDGRQRRRHHRRSHDDDANDSLRTWSTADSPPPPVDDAVVPHKPPEQQNHRTQQKLVGVLPPLSPPSESSSITSSHRRGKVVPRIMILCVPICEEIRTIIKTIGSILVETIDEAPTVTHIVAGSSTKSLRRTTMLMIGMCRTSNVVHLDWLWESFYRRKMLPVEEYLLTSDHKAEHRYGFDMDATLRNGRRARDEGGLLAGCMVYVCPNVAGRRAPDECELQALVHAAGGVVITRVPYLPHEGENGDGAGATNNTPSGVSYIVVTSDPPLPSQVADCTAQGLMEFGAKQIRTSQLFDCIMNQRLDGINDEN